MGNLPNLKRWRFGVGRDNFYAQGRCVASLQNLESRIQESQSSSAALEPGRRCRIDGAIAKFALTAIHSRLMGQRTTLAFVQAMDVSTPLLG